VTEPAQRADHSGPTPAGAAARSTVGSTRVSAGAPSKSPLFQYVAWKPGVSPGTIVDRGTSPSDPWAASTRTRDPARARIPASGVTVAAGAGVTADDPPLMYTASSPEGPMTASERT
jgi:hypothetical protein